MGQIISILSKAGLMCSGLLWGLSYLNFEAVFEAIDTVVLLNAGQLSWTTDSALRFTVDLFTENASPQLMSGVYFTDQSMAWALDVTPEKPWNVRGFEGLATQWWPWIPGSGFDLAVGIPLWMPTAICAGVVLLMGRAARIRERRLLEGLCEACGYDLRGIVARCPECGRPHTANPGLSASPPTTS